MRAARTVIDAAFWLLIALVLLLLTVLRVVPVVTGWHPLTLLGPSMGQTMPLGTFVYVDPEEAVTEGSVITFQTTSTPVTHRVIKVQQDWSGQGIEYITQGDGNKEPDAMPVRPENVIGVVVAHIPVIGLPAWVLSQPVGMLTVISTAFLLLALRSLIPRPAPVLVPTTA